MSFTTDHQVGHLDAGDGYQDGVPAPWTDFQPYVDRLNAERRVTVVREL